MNDPFSDKFYREAEIILGNSFECDKLLHKVFEKSKFDIQELSDILSQQKRKLSQCTTKEQYKTLCVQLIADNLKLTTKLKALANLVEEHLNG